MGSTSIELFREFITELPQRREDAEHCILSVPGSHVDHHAVLGLKVAYLQLYMLSAAIGSADPMFDDIRVDRLRSRAALSLDAGRSVRPQMAPVELVRVGKYSTCREPVRRREHVPGRREVLSVSAANGQYQQGN